MTFLLSTMETPSPLSPLFSPQTCSRDKHTKMHKFKLGLYKTNNPLLHHIRSIQTHRKIHTCAESTKASVQPLILPEPFSSEFNHFIWTAQRADDMPRCPTPCLVCVCPDALGTLTRHLRNPLASTLFSSFLLLYPSLPRTTLLSLVTLNLSTHIIILLSDALRHTVSISLNASSALRPLILPWQDK